MYWVIVFVGAVFFNYLQKQTTFWANLFHRKGLYASILTKVLGLHFGRFFTNTSGHPAGHPVGEAAFKKYLPTLFPLFIF
jgi:hypothetical protein